MDMNLNPYASAAVAGGGTAPVGGASRGAALGPGAGAAFAGSLATALQAVTTSVQEARTQLASAPALADSNALQSTFSSLSALLGQFGDLLQSAGAGPATGVARGVGAAQATSAGAAVPVANSATSTQAQSLSSGMEALRAALFGPAGASAAAVTTAAPASGAGTSAGEQRVTSAPVSGRQSAAAGYAVGSPGHTYLSQLDASNPTDKWMTAALNKAISQAQANGYDPEKSHAVNTLRGYFSGDAQARSSAIHSLDSTMLTAGGAYETFDYGVHTIAGAPPEGMDTNMPSFKTAYDKDWNRPSLYDMINSSLGWQGETPGSSAQHINFADPANRDAALNRKLSDAEIAAFQAGQLPAELQVQVARYRNATMQ